MTLPALLVDAVAALANIRPDHRPALDDLVRDDPEAAADSGDGEM